VVREQASQTGFNAVARPLAFDDDEKVVARASEAVTAPFQFLIQVV
jgi:hypothetical protein